MWLWAAVPSGIKGSLPASILRRPRSCQARPIYLERCSSHLVLLEFNYDAGLFFAGNMVGGLLGFPGAGGRGVGKLGLPPFLEYSRVFNSSIINV